jgi:isoleucyl-tRNA synthetase
MSSVVQDVPQDIKFPEAEKEVLDYWDKHDCFQKSLRMSREENRPIYSFYDGPPFATGMPHYGHILAGTIKDVVTRYAHMNGYRVERKWGWDCHGLPVEYEIDQKLGIKSRDDVLKMTVKAYNAECRSVVMRYADEWKRVVRRMARWIDMDNDYKTLDLKYMESVWWVCKQLFDKDLIYRGYKVMPYSTACSTPLSNFEAGQNYKDVSDPECVVAFPIVGADPPVSLVAWTTTPWTLPSNLALCVHPTLDYVYVKDKKSGARYVMGKTRLSQVFKKEADYEIEKECKGAELEGIKYEPLFPYFVEDKADVAYRVLTDTYVTDDGGTGIVHQAPAFGEDDYRVCLKHGVVAKGEAVPCPIDDDGRFTEKVPDFKGLHVKEADKPILAHLKPGGRLVKSGAIKHSYPFCWRSDTPLIYRVIPSWFVKVEQIRDRLVANNAKTQWVPQAVKEKRFHNWLENARDWAISRNRFWGTPLPIWRSDDWEEIVCVGSVAELKELSGIEVNDLHKDTIDDIQIPSKQGKGMLKRVEEVFDCWFESGSMPYAQCHYPFENKEASTRRAGGSTPSSCSAPRSLTRRPLKTSLSMGWCSRRMARR